MELNFLRSGLLDKETCILCIFLIVCSKLDALKMADLMFYKAISMINVDFMT
jgi:hypothetical protein